MTARQAFWFNVRFFRVFLTPKAWHNYTENGTDVTFTPRGRVR